MCGGMRKVRGSVCVRESTWEKKHQDLEVKVEGGPGGRLVLTDGGNDGDIVLSIGWIQERVEPPSPRRDLCGLCQENTRVQCTSVM